MNELTRALAPVIGLGLIGQYIENAMDIVVELEDMTDLYDHLRSIRDEILLAFNDAEGELIRIAAPEIFE